MNKIVTGMGLAALLLLIGSGCTVKVSKNSTLSSTQRAGQTEVTTSAPLDSEINSETDAAVIVSEPVRPIPPPSGAVETTTTVSVSTSIQAPAVAQAPVVQVAKPTPPPVAVVKKPDQSCSTFACFVEKAKQCEKGEIVQMISGPFIFDPEATQEMTMFYKIEGKNANGLCSFTQQTRGGVIRLSAKGRQMLIEKGKTEAEIDAQLKTMSGSLNDPEITKQIANCTGTEANVAIYLTNGYRSLLTANCTANQEGTRCSYDPGITCVTKAN